MPSRFEIAVLAGLCWLTAETTFAELPANWCSHHGALRLYGDLNNDGLIDTVCYDQAGAKWAALHDGTSWTQTWDNSSLRWCSHSGSNLFLGDVNGDGRADLICKDSDRVWIDYAGADYFRGTDFHVDTEFCTHTGATFQVQDLNGDGFADLDCSGPDSFHQIDLADRAGLFSGVTECTSGEAIQQPFSIIVNGRPKSSVNSSGEMMVASRSAVAEDQHREVCVGTTGSNPYPGAAYISASPTLLDGRLSLAGWPLLGYAQTGAAVRLEVRAADGSRRPLCSDDHVLNEREGPGGEIQDGLGAARLLRCKTAAFQGNYEARVCLRSWATAAGLVEASVIARVRVNSFSFLNCTTD